MEQISIIVNGEPRNVAYFIAYFVFLTLSRLSAVLQPLIFSLNSKVMTEVRLGCAYNNIMHMSSTQSTAME